MRGANRLCRKLRSEMEEDESCRSFDNLDLLVVVFEGVIGAFLPATPQSRSD